MSFQSKTHALIQQFRAVGRLINEWRDTITYVALGAAAATDFFQNGKADINCYLALAGIREFLRFYSWLTLKPQDVANKFSPAVDRGKFVCASAAVTLALGASALPNEPILTVGGTVASLLYTWVGGGLRGIVKSYRTMWDLPRTKFNDGKMSPPKPEAGKVTRIEIHPDTSLRVTSPPSRFFDCHL